MGIQRKPQKSLLELIENQPGKGGLRSLLNPSPHLLCQSPLLMLLHQPFLLGLNRWTLRGGESRRVKTWWKLEDFVQPAKKRLNELQSSKKSATPLVEEQKGEIFSPQHPKLGSQHPCLAVSSWWMTSQSGTSMGALDAMSLQIWSRLYCYPEIC